MPTLDETRAWVSELFAGVTDKGGKTYAEHCFRVEAGLPADADEDARHAALLHDVIEDTPITAFDLIRKGYSRHTAWLVQALSRDESETYAEFITRITKSRDPDLIHIKLSDNRDNSDPDRISCLPPEQRGILERYDKARMVLQAALDRIAQDAGLSSLSDTKE